MGGCDWGPCGHLGPHLGPHLGALQLCGLKLSAVEKCYLVRGCRCGRAYSLTALRCRRFLRGGAAGGAAVR
jgi:hypothetical protein